MKIFSDKQLTISGVWLASIKLFRKTFSRVWPIAVTLGVVEIIHKLLPNGGGNSYQFEKYNMDFFLSDLFVGLIFILLTTYINGVLLHRIYMIGTEHNATLDDSLTFVWKKYFRILGGSLLALLVLMASFVFFPLVIVVSFDNSLLIEIVSALGASVFFGLFIVQFLMILPLILVDDKKCLEAFKNSYSLVWGNWWRIAFPLQLLLALYVFMDLFVFTMPFVKSFIDYYGYGLKIIAIVVVVLLSPLLDAYALVQFGDLKLRHKNAITK